MEDFIKEVLLAFVAAGGCGYLNYYVLTCTNVIEEQKRISIAERFEGYEGETKQEEIWSDEVVGKEEI